MVSAERVDRDENNRAVDRRRTQVPPPTPNGEASSKEGKSENQRNAKNSPGATGSINEPSTSLSHDCWSSAVG
jgi:hypothetical protein